MRTATRTEHAECRDPTSSFQGREAVAPLGTETPIPQPQALGRSRPAFSQNPLFGRPGDNRFDDLRNQEQHDGAPEVLAHGFHVS